MFGLKISISKLVPTCNAESDLVDV